MIFFTKKIHFGYKDIIFVLLSHSTIKFYFIDKPVGIWLR